MGKNGGLTIRVYVAGSIIETLSNQHWRVEWKHWLEGLDSGLVVVDPLIERGGRGFPPREENIAYVVRNDRQLVESCHLLLIVSDLETPSYGTWVEMSWAFDRGLYIILFVDNPGLTADKRLSFFLLRMCDRIIFNDRAELAKVLQRFQQYDHRLI